MKSKSRGKTINLLDTTQQLNSDMKHERNMNKSREEKQVQVGCLIQVLWNQNHFLWLYDFDPYKNVKSDPWNENWDNLTNFAIR